MSIKNRRQLENTRAKLKRMEQLNEKMRQEPADNEHVRDLTLRSLKKSINQFKEENCLVRVPGALAGAGPLRAGLVENGVARLSDSAVKLAENARVMVMASEGRSPGKLPASSLLRW